MTHIFEQSEALWKGEIDPAAISPFETSNEIVGLTDNTWFFKGFSNMIVRDTKDGLIIVDPGDCSPVIKTDGSLAGVENLKFNALRSLTSSRFNTCIYTHGHLNHICGTNRYIEESRSKRRPIPQVIAHEAILSRLDRYREMPPPMECMFETGQGRPPGFTIDFYPPNFLYKDRLDIEIGGVKVLIRHDRGETDDHSWVFFPDTRVLCTGDFFSWALPDAGSLQEAQCFILEWARALRKMASLGPEILAPGHGFLIIGEDRVIRALDDTATLFESILRQTLALMNKGMPLDAVARSVKPPERLVHLPYLQAAGREVEFFVRSIWHLYNGWYDGVPSRLKPAPELDQAAEIARLTGGAEKLAERARELLEDGELRLACHLVQWAHWAAPEDPDIQELMRRVYHARARSETSCLASAIFKAAAGETDGG